MSTRPIKSFSDLKIRIGRFLNSPAFNRKEIRSFLSKVNSIGEVAIFGGMLRDLAISGSAGFKSDVDLVIKIENKNLLEEILSEYSLEKNKFGGFRVSLGIWKVDLWDFNDTWAFKEGYVEGNSIKDLCKTTFFNWDAIAYQLETGTVYSNEGYIESIHSKVLDINLEPNPSPLGNIIKASKYFEKYDASFSPRLTKNIYRVLEEVRNDKFHQFGNEYHKRRLIDIDRLLNLSQAIENHQKHKPLSPFELKKVQHSIW